MLLVTPQESSRRRILVNKNWRKTGTAFGQDGHVDGKSVCVRTILKFEDLTGESVSDEIFRKVHREMSHSFDETRKPIVFPDPKIGDDLCFSTCLYLAEQLYRHGTCPTILGHIVGGKFGEIVATMMVASLPKKKRRRKTEDKHHHVKTRWHNVRNFWNDIPEIHETASAVLFSAVDKIRMLVPESISKKPIRTKLKERRSHTMVDGKSVTIGVQVNLRMFTCYDVFAHEYVECVASMSAEELELLRTIVDHNKQCKDDSGFDDPNGWQFFIANVHHSDQIDDLIGRPVLTIRRLKTSIRAGFSSCVMAAFGAAATRFIILEFGHNTELMKNLEESREDKMSRKVDNEMLPMMLNTVEEIKNGLNSIQQRIVEQIKFANDTEELFRLVNAASESSMHKATFYRHLEGLREIGERQILD